MHFFYVAIKLLEVRRFFKKAKHNFIDQSRWQIKVQ